MLKHLSFLQAGPWKHCIVFLNHQEKNDSSTLTLLLVMFLH